jgi:hypothetical protein
MPDEDDEEDNKLLLILIIVEVNLIQFNMLLVRMGTGKLISQEMELSYGMEWP